MHLIFDKNLLVMQLDMLEMFILGWIMKIEEDTGAPVEMVSWPLM